MITYIVVTAAIGAAFALVEIADVGLSSPWTFVIVAACANAGLLLGWLLSSASRPLQAGRHQRLVSVVEQTLPHMRLGLNPETADQTVRLLHHAMRLEAVAITDRERVLAFVGPGSDHHRAGEPINEGVTRQAIESGEVVVVDRSGLQCDLAKDGDCPLRSAVVAPLMCGGHTVGSLNVYQLTVGPPDSSLVELTRGLAGMLSLQLELAQAHRESQIADIAKLDALRAQINPHFLFNTLNTITMKARTDAEEARRLLVRLSDFLRYAMKHTGHMAPFGEEYFFVRTYLFLEKARYGDHLKVRYDVDPQILSIPVPVLTIQPLVENAIRHGISSKPGGGFVEVRARLEPIGGTLRIRVCDDGVGIEPERIPTLLTPARSDGSALPNINERLIRLYRGRATLEIDSTRGSGTVVSLSLPVS